MIKNLVLVNDYAFVNGGAADVAIQSAIGLTQKYNVYYFAAVGPVCKELERSKVNVVCLGMGDINTWSRIEAIANGIWNRYAKKRFASLLKKLQPETTIVHFHSWCKALSCSVIAEARRQGFTPIITLHEYFSVCPNGGLYNYERNHICQYGAMCWGCVFTNCDKRSYGQKLWRCLRQAVQDRVVKNKEDITYLSISSQNESLIKGVVKSKNIVRVDNPVRLSPLKNESVTASKRFIYVGRLSEEKDVELFCHAIKRLKQKHRDIEGIAIGAGEQMEYLKEQYPQVEFVGWKSQEEVSSYMLSARALVFPSKWYEPAGLTLIEAMSAGLPCIVSSNTPTNDYLINQHNGFVFTTGNIEELESCVEQLLDDDTAIRMHKNIVNEFDSEHYSLQSHIQRLVVVYEAVYKEQCIKDMNNKFVRGGGRNLVIVEIELSHLLVYSSKMIA